VQLVQNELTTEKVIFNRLYILSRVLMSVQFLVLRLGLGKFISSYSGEIVLINLMYII